MLKTNQMFFFITLMIGTMISISSYSWFSMWMGLEINLLSIIPLMKSPNNSYPTEASLKYFIVQTIASMIILFAIIMMLISFNYFPMINSMWYLMMLNSGFFMKLGAAPFHAWFPEVAEGLSWLNNLMLMTWQKIAPMILVSYNLNSSMMSLIIIFSSSIGSIMGLNQISLRKMMAYSSINHIGWMLASMMNLKIIWTIYFTIYTFISINLIISFKMNNSFYLTQFFQVSNQNKLMKLFLVLNLLSLGGLPPFLGFLPKWLVINNLCYNFYYSLALILIIFTLITLYFYLRIGFSALTILSNEMLVNTHFNKNFWILMNILTLMSLTLCSLIFNFI